MSSPEQLRVIFKELFSSAEGKKVLEDLETRFSYKSSTFVPNSDETIYREGQRSVVVFINNMIEDKKPIEQEGAINV
jgi:hypothetical protein|tara:strand:- start:189 stop:419 length:231 start_codon:yes stop_codon:yes gene_type:complete